MADASTDSKALSGAIKGVAAIAALVPGVAMLLRLVPFPPSVEQLLGGLSLAFGAAVVIAVIACRRRIEKANNTVAVTVILLSCAIGAALAIAFFGFATNHIESYKQGDQTVSVVVPLSPSDELVGILTQFGGDYGEALRNPIFAQRTAALMAAQSGSTTALLAAYLLAAQALLIGAIVAGAWKVADFFSRAEDQNGLGGPLNTGDAAGNGSSDSLQKS